MRTTTRCQNRRHARVQDGDVTSSAPFALPSLLLASTKFMATCDLVGSFCAPSLFIAGIGKCGTNALSEHLALHPSVAKISRELEWDPKETPPAALVTHRRVKPTDSRHVWIAKHPKYATADVPALAQRLRAAYPSAKLAIALCDPLALPWRRFLFLLSTAVNRHGTGAGKPETINSLASELRALNSSVRDLFARAFNPFASPTACDRSKPRTTQLLEALSARGFSTLYGNAWLRPGSAGEAKCRQEWRLVSRYSELVQEWVTSLGKVNESVAVVYMEGWRRHGAAYMRVLLRMLRLDTNAFPWQTAADAFSKPVYENTARKHALLSRRLAAVSSSQIFRPLPEWLPADMEAAARARACIQQCDRLLRITGMRPPWCSRLGRPDSDC